MFAVLKTGGKQYRVQSGDVLRVEKLAAQAGETVNFQEILMVGGENTILGTPLVQGASVQAEVIDQIKGEKVIHYVKRRRKHSSQRTKGHRQQLTLLRVTDILTDGKSSGAAKKTRKAEPTAAEAPKGSEPANLLSEARGGQPDDLKKIEGVGPKLEKLLHENGVYHFDQIAAWSDEEVAYMDDKLSFKGRIARDNWIEQAKNFASEEE
ncbi:50S ribosomal protein L21 [Roseitranquillus sediminis]|uniref:50S ribosomal protein L21 n=1 Tax=Roseitranquillus sediminis TaxID=2809051 RepID=UPI001D0CAB21|nr:50S ribosomal protein L21 [Roseitranquillus sediminis]MBM9595510.1 50S ribosomal protein L21 [Roseitranquillus sediminis]